MKSTDRLAVKAFTDTDKWEGRAIHAATEKMNKYLETVPATDVVSIQSQQSTYRDMDGDYPQDMFWFTLLVTARVATETADNYVDPA